MVSDKPVHDLMEEIARNPKTAKAIAANPDSELAARGLSPAQITAVKSLDPEMISNLLQQEAGPAAAGFNPNIKIVIKL